jgi:hypothetical protein
LMEACWERNAPAGKVWEIRLKFLAECAKKYPHLNYGLLNDNTFFNIAN